MNIEKELRDKMIKKAKERHGNIYCLSHLNSLEESFTEAHDDLLFWFNTPDNSTRVISRNIDMKDHVDSSGDKSFLDFLNKSVDRN